MGRTDRASRVIRASPTALYRAFEDPEAISAEDHAAGLSSTLTNLAKFTE